MASRNGTREPSEHAAALQEHSKQSAAILKASKEAGLLRMSAYVDGQWVGEGSNNETEIFDPATGAAIGSVPNLGSEETQGSIAAASRAFLAWRSLTAKTRSTHLIKWHSLIVAHRELLAGIITIEQGKPQKEALGEVDFAAAFVEWFAAECLRSNGELIPGLQEDQRVFVIEQPIGVVGAITPWNFPLAMITRKACPAISVGCTIILKPAPQTPFSALALASLAEMAGIPGGVFNVITGDAEPIGKVLTSHIDVRAISFTGSTPVGKMLLLNSAKTVKRVSLELGGNAPFIVFDDADIDSAVEGAVASKFRNSGQTCICANRFLVQSTVYEEFVAKLAASVASFSVGPGLHSNSTQGPLIDEKAIKKVERHIADARNNGAEIVSGGQRHSIGGSFFEPTIITSEKTDMLYQREETFGPVAFVSRFNDDEQAYALANNSQSGLAAYFYSQNMKRIWHASEKIEAGAIGINTGITSNVSAPFGGVKESGLGREGGSHGIREYVETKYLCMSGL